jgi:hypothetical protein
LTAERPSAPKENFWNCRGPVVRAELEKVRHSAAIDAAAPFQFRVETVGATSGHAAMRVLMPMTGHSRWHLRPSWIVSSTASETGIRATH